MSKTNLERIRTMSVDELAKFFVSSENDCLACTCCNYDHVNENDMHSCSFSGVCTKDYAATMVKMWLESESKEYVKNENNRLNN